MIGAPLGADCAASRKFVTLLRFGPPPPPRFRRLLFATSGPIVEVSCFLLVVGPLRWLAAVAAAAAASAAASATANGFVAVTSTMSVAGTVGLGGLWRGHHRRFCRGRCRCLDRRRCAVLAVAVVSREGAAAAAVAATAAATVAATVAAAAAVAAAAVVPGVAAVAGAAVSAAAIAAAAAACVAVVAAAAAAASVAVVDSAVGPVASAAVAAACAAAVSALLPPPLPLSLPPPRHLSLPRPLPPSWSPLLPRLLLLRQQQSLLAIAVAAVAAAAVATDSVFFTAAAPDSVAGSAAACGTVAVAICGGCRDWRLGVSSCHRRGRCRGHGLCLCYGVPCLCYGVSRFLFLLPLPRRLSLCSTRRAAFVVAAAAAYWAIAAAAAVAGAPAAARCSYHRFGVSFCRLQYVCGSGRGGLCYCFCRGVCCCCHRCCCRGRVRGEWRLPGLAAWRMSLPLPLPL